MSCFNFFYVQLVIFKYSVMDIIGMVLYSLKYFQVIVYYNESWRFNVNSYYKCCEWFIIDLQIIEEFEWMKYYFVIIQDVW